MLLVLFGVLLMLLVLFGGFVDVVGVVVEFLLMLL